MLHKNQYLLLPHTPSKIDPPSNGTTSNNETSETSDLNIDPQNTVNHNFLMENHNSENHIAMINENDENYFEIFKTPMKFGTENNTEVTAQIGTTAHLPCTIHNVGEGVVSFHAIIFSSRFFLQNLTRKKKFSIFQIFKSRKIANFSHQQSASDAHRI
jgi:hypothetical protein